MTKSSSRAYFAALKSIVSKFFGLNLTIKQKNYIFAKLKQTENFCMSLRISILLLAAVLFFASCNKESFDRVLKSDDYDLKYQKAKEYYAAGKYEKAMDLYKQLVPHERGRERGAEVYFYYAMCNYKIGDYLIAAYYFKDFAQEYPNSKYTEDALFLSAYCYYLESPRWSLDQEQTKEAITQFQIFISKFPDSPLIDSCNTLIDKLNYKLQKKAYMNAKLYYDLGYYKSADIALQNALNDYPDSPFAEDILYYQILSNYEYALNSVRAKQKERFQKTIDKVLTYKEFYPNGKYSKDVEKIYQNSQKKLKQLPSES